MRYCILFFLLVAFADVFSQTVRDRSNEINVDFSDPRRDNSVSIPTINWTTPADSVVTLKDGKFLMVAEVTSIYGLNSVKLRLRDKKNNTVIKEFKLTIEENSKNVLKIERTLDLPNGKIEIEVLAQNMEGFYARVYRIANVGH